MNNHHCWVCYKPIPEGNEKFHDSCSRRIFGSPKPPVLDYINDQMLELAERIVKNQITITGVQPKLSLGIKKISGRTAREKLTIVGVWGEYILKPPSVTYSHLPELEDLTMHLAEIAEIETVPHSLISLKSGELAYITKRIDRYEKRKLAMEDMCQLTERLTEQKYHSSYEQIGKAIMKYSAAPGLDIVNFFTQVLFCFLTANNDMHLKNFSLINTTGSGYSLSPAYDMVAAGLVVEGDAEELALTLNGKKKNIRYNDFLQAINSFPVTQKAMNNIFSRLERSIPEWVEFIQHSFLPEPMKADFRDVIIRRAKQIGILV